ncbi:MAG: 50S ribosomal protein L9 [Holophagae bacterium]|jgi:large subunit ribosomal protein L9|nr:MAG: 50S ribosomal protein L9 [Holophagae bacterium]
MKVILTDHVEHLGERGDSVSVKPGYARNYLLPKGLAYLDTPGNRKLFQQQQSGWQAMDLERRSTAEKIAAELARVELHFERRAGERDVLFGSVTLVDIARELEQRGFELERRRIRLDQPIKTLGTSMVEVAIHRDIAVTIPVHVVRPGDQAEPGQEPAGDSPAAEPTAASAGPSGSDLAAG